MRKTTLTIAAIAAAVVIGGGGAAYALTSANTSTPVATPTSSATSTPTNTATASNSPSPTATSTNTSDPVPTAGPTATGDVCDPHNANDVICAAFYPDQVVINMTSAPRVGEPLASLAATERIALAHKACDQLAAGKTLKTVSLISTDPASAKRGADNNYTLASAGALAYCNAFIEGDTFKQALEKYRSMGEDAAKASFAHGVPVKP